MLASPECTYSLLSLMTSRFELGENGGDRQVNRYNSTAGGKDQSRINFLKSIGIPVCICYPSPSY